MNKDIYFQNEAWGDVAIQHNGQVHHFSNLMSLISFLQPIYGTDFNLIEVTEDNYQTLYDLGAFDDQKFNFYPLQSRCVIADLVTSRIITY